jgi:hypothetical protein
MNNYNDLPQYKKDRLKELQSLIRKTKKPAFTLA